MDNEKLESILNLALETEEEVREKSGILRNGYDFENNIWEVIIKFHGDILWMETQVESLEILLNGYGIMRATRPQLMEVLQSEQIEFVELPKTLLFDTYQAKLRSCILPVTTGGGGLTGRGTLIAVLDSGIQYLLPDFQDAQGSRIAYLWDQTLQPDVTKEFLAPQGFAKGVEFSKEDINRAIRAGTGGMVENGATEAVAGTGSLPVQNVNYEAAWQIVPSRDISGHGTAVAGIAGGSARSRLYQGIAPECEFLIVKLGGNQQSGRFVSEGNLRTGQNSTPNIQNFPLTTDLMRGITYVLRKAQELGAPIAINLSIGDTYGAHDGTSLLERFMDAACETGRNVICIGSGNEAVSGGHQEVALANRTTVELSVAQTERSINVQIWKNYVDIIALALIAPNGDAYSVNLNRTGKQEWIVGNTRVLIYVSPPTPYSVNEEIFFDFIPLGEYVTNGIWRFVVEPIGENRQSIHFYLPNSAVRNAQTRFLRSDPNLSMTIPAFAFQAITVGAYDTVLNAYADFSGRDREVGREEGNFFAVSSKPDIAAPGVGIMAPTTDGNYASFSGTSFATPIVTGSAALLMEWGIVRGEDVFLYGEKLKAYLRRGAKPLLDETRYPNNKTGWGALCLAAAFPI